MKGLIFELFTLPSCSGSTCSLSVALEKMGLSDIMLIVRLMCLCASGKIVSPDKLTGNQDAAHVGLQHLTSAVGSLVEENSKAQRQLLHLCTKVIYLNEYVTHHAKRDCMGIVKSIHPGQGRNFLLLADFLCINLFTNDKV